MIKSLQAKNYHTDHIVWLIHGLYSFNDVIYTYITKLKYFIAHNDVDILLSQALKLLIIFTH